MRNCIVAQSGGPTVAINASLSGVIEKAYTSGSYDHIYGSLHGILGILNNDIICFDDKLEDETFLQALPLTQNFMKNPSQLWACQRPLITICV